MLSCVVGRESLFRGHRDDWKNMGYNRHANRENFVTLLQFGVKSGDSVLAEHLKPANRNALYTSKTTQNQLIEVCGSIIRNSILEQIRTASQFSIMADEATDSTNDEQLSISV